LIFLVSFQEGDIKKTSTQEDYLQAKLKETELLC